MEKKRFLSFPNYRKINLKQLSTISIEIQGCCYTSQRRENEDRGVICYYPRPSSLLFYNSFLPIITVEEMIGSPGVVLSIDGKYSRIVLAGLSFFYVILGLLQCFLIKIYLDGFLETPFVGFIPIIIIAFLFTLSTTTKSFVIKSFAVKYRTQIEKLISMESTT